MRTILETDIPTWKWEQVEKYKQKLKEVIDFYYSVACPCAFPRFRQLVSIDCFNTEGTFYLYETNLLIREVMTNRFEIQKENNDVFVSCNVCDSKYIIDGDEFGFLVQRLVLKMIDKKVEDIRK